MTANARLYSPRIALPVQAETPEDAQERAAAVQLLIHQLVNVVNMPPSDHQRQWVDDLCTSLVRQLRDQPKQDETFARQVKTYLVRRKVTHRVLVNAADGDDIVSLACESPQDLWEWYDEEYDWEEHDSKEDWS